MSNTNDALVVMAALSGRYARAGRSVSRSLLTMYRELDARHEKSDGPNAAQGAADAERFYRYAEAEADIDARRLAEFPELKPALDMPICKEWKDHARISEQDGFIPKVDTEGRAAALQAAERIRRRGGLLTKQEDGTLTGPHDVMNLSLDAMSHSQIYSIGARITERVVAVSQEPWVDPGHIRRAAEIHTDEAMAACGLTERWA